MRLQTASILDAALLLGSGLTAAVALGLRRVRPDAGTPAPVSAPGSASHPVVAPAVDG